MQKIEISCLFAVHKEVVPSENLLIFPSIPLHSTKARKKKLLGRYVLLTFAAPASESDE